MTFKGPKKGGLGPSFWCFLDSIPNVNLAWYTTVQFLGVRQLMIYPVYSSRSA
jgi:hypothetical protein